jgi:hypothetical protein
MGIHEDHTGRHKEHQLDQRMIHHMEQGSMYRKSILFSKKSLHTHAHQDKSNLRHGGAGQSPLKINGKDRQQGTAEHGQHADPKDQFTPGGIVKKQIGRNHKDSKHTGFCQDTGQQR